MKWLPIKEAPKDGTIIDIWCEGDNIRHTNMRRVNLGKGNIFYEPYKCGASCVRTATHFLIFTKPEL